jgi:Fur family ferric uptake transcriptional regulator
MSDIAAMLHESGLKATPARKRVLELLSVAREPLSHTSMEAQIAQEDGAPLDRVTLYRVLDALVAAGLAVKAVDARGVSRFAARDARRRHEGHVHFRCTGCGNVFCLKAEPPRPPRLPRGFRLDAIELDVRGVCAACRPASAAGESS